MIPSFEARHSRGGRACPCFGGDSSSASTTQNTTNNYDQRRVQDASNGGMLLDHSNVDVTDARRYTDASSMTAIDARNLSDASTKTTASGGGIIGYGNTTTDFGAISGAVGVANTALNTNAHNLETLLSAADHLFTQQQHSLDTNVALTQTLAGTAQKAYSDATSQASGQKNLILVGVAVVGIVAFSALKGH